MTEEEAYNIISEVLPGITVLWIAQSESPVDWIGGTRTHVTVFSYENRARRSIGHEWDIKLFERHVRLRLSWRVKQVYGTLRDVEFPTLREALIYLRLSSVYAQ